MKTRPCASCERYLRSERASLCRYCRPRNPRVQIRKRATAWFFVYLVVRVFLSWAFGMIERNSLARNSLAPGDAVRLEVRR